MIQSAGTESHTEKIVEALATRFKPACIYLFGSRARGDHRPDSDYDIYMEVSRANWPEDEDHTLNGILIGFRDAQVHVRVPGWLRKKKDEPGNITWDVAREGILLYNTRGFRRVIPSEPPLRVREPAPRNPRALAEWLRLARLDFDLVMHLSSDIERWKEPICFHAQQSAEKYLKALGMSAGRSLPPIHDLPTLLHDARSLGFILGGLDRHCQRLTRYAIEGRYPAPEGVGFPVRRRISLDNAADAIGHAQAIKSAVEQELP